MKYFFDTEFAERGDDIRLMSIGIVAEDGREFYGELPQNYWAHLASPWLYNNVVDKMFKQPTDLQGPLGLRAAITAFVGNDARPEFWAYYATHDWYLLMRLMGGFKDLPANWPQYVHDAAIELSPFLSRDCQIDNPLPHHALSDARWLRDCWKYYTGIREAA